MTRTTLKARKDSRRIKLRGGGMVDNAYHGASAYGRFVGWMSLLSGLFFGLILLGVGAYLAFFIKVQHSQKTTSTVKTAQCQRNEGSKAANNVDCDLTVEYIVGGKQYTQSLNYPGNFQKVVPNTKIDISYNPDNPEDITTGISWALIGWICIIISILIIVGSVSSWYATQHYSAASAAMGVGSMVGMVMPPSN